VDAPRTKLLAEKLRGMGLDDVLIITDRIDDNLRLSSRNLPNVGVLTVGEADPLSLMQFARVLVTKGAVAKIEELLK
jgi:large subunit ribosomal protein L4